MAEASHEALNCKTLYLKVSIHCEGCKKKVRRVLQKTEGVYKVDIDSFQHKVTVQCNVDHETLIRKLVKSGKQASVWPEAKKPGGNPMPGNMSNDTKNQSKESNSKPKNKEPKESSENLNSKEKQPEPAKGDEKEKEKEKPKNEDETKSKPQEKEKEKEKDVVKEKPKEKEKEKAKEQSEQEAKPNSEGGEKKKEKKEEKEKKNESSGKEGGQHVEKGIGSGPLQPKQEFMYQPYSQPYSYPYLAPQPIMSYHAAQPSSSQAYYQQPPMPGTQGYMYPYPDTNPHQYQHQYQSSYQYPYGAPSEFSYGTTESSTRGEDHLSYFNEENANSCSVM